MSIALAMKVVVLPVGTGGYLPRRAMWQSEFSLRVHEEVKKAKHQVVSPGPLSGAEETCREAECAESLASRVRADAIVGARVMSNDKVPPSYHVEVWLYDRSRPGAVQRRSELCTSCTESNAAELVTRLTRELLAGKVDTPPTPSPVPLASPAPSPSPMPAPNSVVATTTAPSNKKTIFKATGFTAAALAVAGLGLLIAGAVRHDACEDSACSRKTDAAGALGLGATSFALFGAGSGVLLWQGFKQ